MSETSFNAQSEVIKFLRSAKVFSTPDPVSHVQTHCAHIFLGGDVALKIKRAVRYDYLDQSTPELRHTLLDRELALNRTTAPMIYRDVVPVTRDDAGGLELNANGTPVEWVLRMHRFSADCEMPAVAASGRLTDQVAEALGRIVQRFHASCPVLHNRGDVLIHDIIDELERVLQPFDRAVGGGLVSTFLHRARHVLTALTPVLKERSALGHVKRAHGDLHLRNLLLIDGKPVLFDALEFDERLATCDVLYDLAFLLMDLCHSGYVQQANIAMTAYLLAGLGAEDAGMAALPLFMSVRAAIRAMVMLQTGQATGQTAVSTDEARRYLTQAVGYFDSQKPVLIAVGGMSGVGKTVLARDLATGITPCPGAVHLRTDTERKAQAVSVDYSPSARSATYDRMLARAETLLAAGRSVILDGTFLEKVKRATAETVAARIGVGFCGLWLVAPQSVLIDRVASRHGDASDADAAVVTAQASSASAGGQWQHWVTIDASNTMQMTRAAAGAALDGVLGTRSGTGAGPRAL